MYASLNPAAELPTLCVVTFCPMLFLLTLALASSGEAASPAARPRPLPIIHAVVGGKFGASDTCLSTKFRLFCIDRSPPAEACSSSSMLEETTASTRLG